MIKQNETEHNDHFIPNRLMNAVFFFYVWSAGFWGYFGAYLIGSGGLGTLFIIGFLLCTDGIGWTGCTLGGGTFGDDEDEAPSALQASSKLKLRSFLGATGDLVLGTSGFWTGPVPKRALMLASLIAGGCGFGSSFFATSPNMLNISLFFFSPTGSGFLWRLFWLWFD